MQAVVFRQPAFIRIMKLKELFDRISFYFTVPKCVGCGKRLGVNDNTLCPECIKLHSQLKTRNCSICSKTLDKCDCSNKFLKSHKIKRVFKLFRYIPDEEGTPSNNLIYSLKRNNRRDVVNFLADELTAVISNSITNYKDFIITNVPRRKSAVKQYGYDHAAVLSKAIAKRLEIRYESLLKSKAKRAQKKMSSEERRENARAVPRKNIDLKGKRIILLDDIITTGSSMAVCADVLKSLRAKEIVGVAISIAYKDEYTPFPKSEYVYW